jgi:circadian clock protein KaiC
MHSNELRLFEIDDDGIQIGGTLIGHEGLLGGRPTRREGSGGAGPGADDA